MYIVAYKRRYKAYPKTPHPSTHPYKLLLLAPPYSLRTVVIEDSEIGLTAAKAAGMKCIVTKSSYTKNENFHNADLVIDELGEGAGALPFQAIKDFAFK